jgi:CRP-like cAMP-binding protein
MLTIYDLDENAQKLTLQCNPLIQKLYPFFTLAQAQLIKHQEDVSERFPGSVLIVTKGIFKVFFNDKFIRFYKAGDIVVTSGTADGNPIKIVSEMASEIKYMATDTYVKTLCTCPDMLTVWSDYLALQNQITTGICASMIINDKAYDINLKTFYPGDAIIREDEFPDSLYEMVDGRATVFVKGTEIGTINPSEIFGEVSFLTGLNRTASVIADSTCLVQCIDGEFFPSLVRQRPAMVQKMARTIAHRLSEVNEKLVRITTLT